MGTDGHPARPFSSHEYAAERRTTIPAIAGCAATISHFYMHTYPVDGCRRGRVLFDFFFDGISDHEKNQRLPIAFQQESSGPL